MATDKVIVIENLSKRYLLSHQPRSGTLRDTLAQGASGLWQSLKRGRIGPDTREEFWALKDFSLTVKRGDVVGVIGRNGAGKSTLLKLLSRITAPTTGRITLQGRIASLLEVGTGFHPDLTGRENIFMNGSILGMRRAEIRAKFDQIVEFAGIERFLDTPLRRYSSGMSVRLAFAVSAHLDPELLLLDEVLAVGDADFQRKCLGKMNEVAKNEGRTILFVSHNLASVAQLCNRVVVLQGGRLLCDADTTTGIAKYMEGVNAHSLSTQAREHGEALSLENPGASATSVECFQSITLSLRLRAKVRTSLIEFCILVHNCQGQRVALVDLRSEQGTRILQQGESLDVEVQLQQLSLVPGTYSAGVFIRSDHHMQDHLGMYSFEIMPTSSSGGLVGYGAEYMGYVAIKSKAQIKPSQ